MSFIAFVRLLCYQAVRRFISAIQGWTPLCFPNCDRDLYILTSPIPLSGYTSGCVDFFFNPSLHLRGAMWCVLNNGMFKDNGFCEAGKTLRGCNRAAGRYGLHPFFLSSHILKLLWVASLMYSQVWKMSTQWCQQCTDVWGGHGDV